MAQEHEPQEPVDFSFLTPTDEAELQAPGLVEQCRSHLVKAGEFAVDSLRWAAPKLRHPKVALEQAASNFAHAGGHNFHALTPPNKDK